MLLLKTPQKMNSKGQASIWSCTPYLKTFFTFKMNECWLSLKPIKSKKKQKVDILSIWDTSSPLPNVVSKTFSNFKALLDGPNVGSLFSTYSLSPARNSNGII
jgi:hypothetical protein